MVTKEEFQEGISETLKEIRVKHHMSKQRIADECFIDVKTWTRYEDGTTCPSAQDLVAIFNCMNEHILPWMLAVLYPDTYRGLDQSSDIVALRQAAAHYFLNVASDRAVREWDYLIFGRHGSNIEPQLNEFTMIDHLPLDYRVAVANLVISLYRIAEANGQLVGTDHVMPNVDVVVDGLKKAQRSAELNGSGYTTAQA